MEVKKKISLSYSIFLYVVIQIIVSAAIAFAEFVLLYVFIKFVKNENIFINFSNIIDSIPYYVTKNIIKVFTYIFVYIFILRKKYVIDSKKDEFMHYFLLFLIILFSLSLIINTLDGTKSLKRRIQSIEIVNGTLERIIDDDMENYKRYVENSPWEKCTSVKEIREVTYNENNNVIYEELSSRIIILTTEILANIFIIEIFIKKEFNIFES